MKSANLKKRAFAVFTALALLGLTATACAAEPRKIKITVGIWRGTSAEEKAYYEECKRRFEETYPQYEIVSSPYAYAADTIAAKYASGQLPTVFEMEAELVKDAYSSGYISAVSAYMESYGWLEKTDDFFMTEIAVDNEICGIPSEQYAAGMVLNLPMLYGAGIIECDDDGNYIVYKDGEAAYPDTFEKLEKAAKKISETYSMGVRGLFLASGDAESGKLFSDIAYNFGSGHFEYADADGVWKLSLIHDEFMSAIRWVRQMSQERYLYSEKYDSDWMGKMAREEVAAAFCRSDQLAAALSAEPSLIGKIAFVPMPHAEGETARSLWGGKVFAVSGRASVEQTEGVFRFLKYFGYGPDTDGLSLRFAEQRLQIIQSAGEVVLPVIPVWKDEEYLESLAGLYAEYVNVDGERFNGFYNGFYERRLTGEPYARQKLYLVVDELFGKILYEATTVNIVTLVVECETEFTEKYLSDKGAYL